MKMYLCDKRSFLCRWVAGDYKTTIDRGYKKSGKKSRCLLLPLVAIAVVVTV